MNLPHFIVLGGHKCGTSSLHSYLAQHPEVYLPQIKGIDFFNREGNLGCIKTIEEYQTLYSNMTNEKVAGEVSSVYLHSERACKTIQRYLPKVKLIAVLRNPVDRAFSNFNVLPENQRRERNYRGIFDEEKVLKKGFYSYALKMYFDAFSISQIRVLLFDSLVKDKETFFRDLFEFIGVNSNFIPDTSTILRKGGKIKHKNLQQFFENKTLVKSTIGAVLKPFTTPEQRYSLHKRFTNMWINPNKLPEDIRVKLIDFYREDILKVQDLLDIDLSHWLKAESKN